MSYIMRALKRAEQEREAQRVVVPSDAPHRPAPRRPPWWPIVVTALFAVNGIALTLMLWPESSAPVRDRAAVDERGVEPAAPTVARSADEGESRVQPGERRSARAGDAERATEPKAAITHSTRSESTASSATTRAPSTTAQSAPPRTAMESRAPFAAVVTTTPGPTAGDASSATPPGPSRGREATSRSSPVTAPAEPVDHGRDTARAVPSTQSTSGIFGGRSPSSTTGPKIGTLIAPPVMPTAPPTSTAAGTPVPTTTPSAPAGTAVTKPQAAPSAPKPPAPAPPDVAQALKLEVLVYGESAAGRMVFINGRKYVEGQTVEGGFVIDRITEEGAVLSGRGRTFMLEPPHR